MNKIFPILPRLFVVVSILFLSGCIAQSNSRPAPVRIASGPPLAWGLEPEKRRISPTRTNVYTVQPGDTLWAIAVVHGLDPEQLARWNNLRRPDQLFVGQGLRVRKPVPVLPVGKKRTSFTVAPPASTPAPPQRMVQKPVPPPPPPVVERPVRTALPTPAPARNKKARWKRSKNTWVLKARAPKRWLWPIEGKILRAFGRKGARRNNGIDIAGQAGEPVRAAAAGVVAYADDALPGYGNLILLRHGGSFMSAYAHNSKILVQRGQSVRAGEIIAKVGKSGGAATPRLHFELRKRIKPLNPIRYLPSRKKR